MNKCLSNDDCECWISEKTVNGHDLCYEYDCFTDSLWFNCLTCGHVVLVTDKERTSIESIAGFSQRHAGAV